MHNGISFQFLESYVPYKLFLIVIIVIFHYYNFQKEDDLFCSTAKFVLGVSLTTIVNQSTDF